ncbi:hypothetical protein K2X33_04590 [bacterium]|nr:hypothetical protein [bacterium]
MLSKKRHNLIWGLAVLVTVACTDGRARVTTTVFSSVDSPETSLQLVADVQSKDGATGNAVSTNALQMFIKGTSLFMTGTPFMFARWELGQDMENPMPTFEGNKKLTNFTAMGAWPVDSYASGAVTTYGNTAFMSGMSGTSVISMAETMNPKEIQRYPLASPQGIPITQEDYTYTAMVTHPTKPIIYAFKRQDYLYTLDLSSGTVKIGAKDAYGSSGQSVCCVMGAAVLQNKIFVAFRDRLLVFEIGSDGRLINPKEATDINAVNVVATPRYVYVQHEPTSSPTAGSARPSGIYVLDSSIKNVGFFKASSPRRFAVSQDDTHFYSNLEGTRVKIFRILWTN